MSFIKSFSVGQGDMFYIKHDSDNFTVIDCCLISENSDEIIEELKAHSKSVGITRFISTSPDNDHIRGLNELHEAINILNFYVVKNKVPKNNDNIDFQTYCYLRDHENKAFNIFKGCTRKWMNISDEVRDHSGLNILWPQRDNKYFIQALTSANEDGKPNNISPIISYTTPNGINILWMGDLEKDFLSSVAPDIGFTHVDILFAPHHGRDSGKIQEKILKTLSPHIIVIGEASSDYLNYYQGYNTITQNSAGDITFEFRDNIIDVFVSNMNYSVPFLRNRGILSLENYLGSMIL